MKRFIAFFIGALRGLLGVIIPSVRETAQQRYNVKMGLPKDWHPPQYLGPPISHAPERTPNGIVVDSRGYTRASIQEYKGGLRARVDLEGIDSVWSRVIQEMVSEDWVRTVRGVDRRLTPEQRDEVRGLDASLKRPKVVIQPSIWWEPTNLCYVAGLTSNRPIGTIWVAVWYRSVLDSSLKNWETLLHWEFANYVLLCIGCRDMAY